VTVQSLSTVTAIALSAVFAMGALLNVAGNSPLSRAYERWGFPPGYRWLAVVSGAVTAAFLLLPITRIWGVASGALIMFVTETILFSRGLYWFAVPGLMIMAAFVPASFSGLY
jgi:hypothetical protein